MIDIKIHMEKIVSTITVLYDKYRNNPKTLEKLNYYITKELPINIEVYHNKEQNRIILEKQIDMYINTFLNSSQNQYFYIEKTDTFISYDGLDFKIINEDEIWYNILSEISNNNNLTTLWELCKYYLIQSGFNNKYENIKNLRQTPESYNYLNQ